ncbi:MAG: hypothetical protein AAGE89_01605 [Pseudomonadota bacterium]
MKTALRTSITKDMSHIRPIALLSALHLGVTLLAAGFTVKAYAGEAGAGDVTKAAPINGSVTMSHNPGTSPSVIGSGSEGIVTTGTVECGGTIIIACERRYHVVGPDGYSYSGERASVYVPYRSGSVTTVTGPDGKSVAGKRSAHTPNQLYRD